MRISSPESSRQLGGGAASLVQVQEYAQQDQNQEKFRSRPKTKRRFPFYFHISLLAFVVSHVTI